jgi:hypothetical protein
MLFVTSATLAVALILQPTASNVSSIPTWKTLPLEQPLPRLAKEGYVDREGARVWYGTAGKGEPLILLHGAIFDHECCGDHRDVRSPGDSDENQLRKSS